MRCCKDVILATSSDVSIATIWKLQSDVRERRRNDVVTTFLFLLESKYNNEANNEVKADNEAVVFTKFHFI